MKVAVFTDKTKNVSPFVKHCSFWFERVEKYPKRNPLEIETIILRLKTKSVSKSDRKVFNYDCHSLFPCDVS